MGDLIDDGREHKKAKETKKCVIKQKLMFENYKDCLFNNKTVSRSQEKFKSYYHDVYTEEVNKIALNSKDNKRLQTFVRVTTYPYGPNEMMNYNKYKWSILMITLMKIKPSVTKIGQIFLINPRRFRIWKNKCIIEFNKKPTRH